MLLASLRFVACLLRLLLDIVLQKVLARKVPKLQHVGGSTVGLTALVTGATGGLGRSTAIELGRRGASRAHCILTRGMTCVGRLSTAACAQQMYH